MLSYTSIVCQKMFRYKFQIWTNREEQLVGTNQCWSFTALRQFGDYNPIKIEMMMISSIRNMMMLIIPIKNDDDQLFCGHFSASPR